MKKMFLLLLLSLFYLYSLADHLKGGSMYYEYLGSGSTPNTLKYRITLKQYLRCGTLQTDQNVYLGIFDGASNQLLKTDSMLLIRSEIAQKSDFSCIVRPPPVCYQIDTYVLVLDLPNNTSGYTLSIQRCCRILGIINMYDLNGVGITYTNKIPGIINGKIYRNNSSPVFAQKDTAIICKNTRFSFDFSATDADRDSLSYSFIIGILGGDNSLSGSKPTAPIIPPPPYIPNATIPYTPGFSGKNPMGPGVTINPVTGIISGIAPDTIGTYIVAVTANEYRGGVLIGSTRKEIHIDVGNCQLTAASLKPNYSTCDGYAITFKNETATLPGTTYEWDFGNPASGVNNISFSPTPTHVFTDTGIYRIKLKAKGTAGCQDSATALAYIYPGLFPAFSNQIQCKNIQFTDISKTNFGNVNTWFWDFGDPSSTTDTSSTQNPKYTYPAFGIYTVTLSITNSKGCMASFTSSINITGKAALQITKDTLICSIDTLQLNALGNGTIVWTPNYNINDQFNQSPLVSPDVPTTYYAALTDSFGCKAFDSVFVNVIQRVTIDAGKDTGICLGDGVQLNSISNALFYQWSPSIMLSNNMIKNPIAAPLVTTKYYVTGNVGKCQSTDSIIVKVAPIPSPIATRDTIICLGQSIQLNVSGGSIYTWSPASFLNNPNIADPISKPDKNVRYLVAVRDTLGCEKPAFDTVTVLVQKIIANAGTRDTSILVNQPLQLNATGGEFYLWSPSSFLNNATIPNPIAIINTPGNFNYAVTISNARGCFATDTLSVTVYKNLGGLYVPNAFTPNADGKNDVFNIIPIGIKQIKYFRIFNRWGQIIFSSLEAKKGWDGKFKGLPQDVGVYIWMIEGLDYQDKKIMQKGTITLLR